MPSIHLLRALTLLTALVVASATHAASGDLDPTFDGDGPPAGRALDTRAP